MQLQLEQYSSEILKSNLGNIELFLKLKNSFPDLLTGEGLLL